MVGAPLGLSSVGWRFDNSYARLPEIMLSQISPVPVKTPKLIILNTPSNPTGAVFDKKELNQLLDLAKKNNIFILHRNKKSREILPNYFNLIDERSYGVSKIIIGRLNI